MKKLLCIIFSCAILLSFSSCSLAERFAGDMSQLDYDEDHNLLYNDNAYYRADDRFEVMTEDNDKVVELGWQSQFPFFPDIHYYAFDEDNPLFILFVFTCVQTPFHSFKPTKGYKKDIATKKL